MHYLHTGGSQWGLAWGCRSCKALSCPMVSLGIPHESLNSPESSALRRCFVLKRERAVFSLWWIGGQAPRRGDSLQGWECTEREGVLAGHAARGAARLVMVLPAFRPFSHRGHWLLGHWPRLSTLRSTERWAEDNPGPKPAINLSRLDFPFLGAALCICVRTIA